MSRLRQLPERHFVNRIGWLRAAVLGANDGILSTASLIVGVAAASATQNAVLIAGVAGLVAGAMSMAAGEYVSVSSQSDSEQADLARERKELSESPRFELDELAEIYVKRGVDRDLARQVAGQLMAKDALGAHAHDELGISEITTARPVQAALTSAVSFSLGAAMPVIMVVVSPSSALVPIVSAASLGFLAVLGAIGASVGGAHILRGTARVTFWGALAMALTAGIARLSEVWGGGSHQSTSPKRVYSMSGTMIDLGQFNFAVAAFSSAFIPSFEGAPPAKPNYPMARPLSFS